MIPSGIKRDSKTPFRTRKLENGIVVIEDAYEGRYSYSKDQDSGVVIKGIELEDQERTPKI